MVNFVIFWILLCSIGSFIGAISFVVLGDMEFLIMTLVLLANIVYALTQYMNSDPMNKTDHIQSD